MDQDRDQGDQPWVDAEEAGGLHQGPWGSRDQDPAAALRLPGPAHPLSRSRVSPPAQAGPRSVGTRKKGAPLQDLFSAPFGHDFPQPDRHYPEFPLPTLLDRGHSAVLPPPPVDMDSEIL